jgi:hypothetical protein
MAPERHRFMPNRDPLNSATGATSWLVGLRRRLALVLALAVGMGLGIFLAGPSAPPGAPPAHVSLAPPDAPGASLGGGAPLTQPPPSAAPTTQVPTVVIPLPTPQGAAPVMPAPNASVAPSAPPRETAGQSAALPPASDAKPPREPGSVQPTVIPRRVVPADGLPAWRRNAVAAPTVAGKAMIAVVVDDMGVDQRRSAEMVKLPGALTLSYLPYGRDLPRQTAEARAAGHELLVHVSMEPLDPKIKPGPNALTVDLPEEEIRRRLGWALDAFGGYVGINNHMGSRFTSERPGMDVVMDELRARGLLFLDSRTVQHSVGATVASAHGVPHAGRHFFLDNELSIAEVNRQLAETERVARQTGFAVAIGHPHDVTIAALRAWLPTLEERGFVLVPISAVVEHLEARRGEGQQSAAPRDETRVRNEQVAP